MTTVVRQESETSRYFAAWVFSHPAPMSASCESSESLKFRKITIVETIYQSTSMTRPTTNSSTSHSIETAKKMGVLVALPACGYPPAILCFCSLSLTILTDDTRGLLHQRSDVALCLICSHSECICSRNCPDRRTPPIALLLPVPHRDPPKKVFKWETVATRACARRSDPSLTID